MDKAPETIYLIPGEDIDGVMGYLWCDDPAPSHDHDPAEAMKYARKDVALKMQADAVAKFGSDTASETGVIALAKKAMDYAKRPRQQAHEIESGDNNE